jgi:aminoglycoside phosphotransferase family enzyme/predicted kinase
VENSCDDQSETIAFLATPQAYGLAADARVERIDTHAACVFLVGGTVYKLKRAVQFPFLDFSTSERRRVFCADEVRLNRRTAPALYLGVAPIRRENGRLVLGETVPPDAVTAPAEDWVVVMRRFEEEKLLARVADRGELTAQIVAQLARSIASFHATAKIEPDNGGGEVLRHTVAMDVQQMQARGELLDPRLSAELARLMPAEAERQSTLADRRRAIGAVRRCHGDLHLKNIYLDASGPLAFDGIEFNDRLSCIDVLYDLSFLLMDLDFRGLRSFANLALNTWLWHSHEKDADALAALALLPVYLARRAAIRAHVDAAGVPHLRDDAEAARQRDVARRYQSYARALFPPPAPKLVAVGGLSGTGKTTLAMALAPDFAPTPGAVVLRSDVLRKRLAGVALEERMPQGWYTQENSAAIYVELHRLAGIALAAGRSVILDGVYARPEERQAAEDVAREAGVDFAGLWLQAPTPILKARVADRTADASDATVAVVERQTQYALGEIAWRRLDAGQGLEALRAQAVAALAGLTQINAAPNFKV